MGLKRLSLFQPISIHSILGEFDHNALEQRTHLSLHHCKVDFSHIHTSPGNGHNIHGQGKKVLVEAKRLPNQSFQPIAGNGIPEFTADGHSQTPEKKTLSPGQGKENKVV